MVVESGRSIQVWPPPERPQPIPRKRPERKQPERKQPRPAIQIFPIEPNRLPERVTRYRRMTCNPNMPPLDPNDAEMMVCLRREARVRLARGIPDWMDFDDLVHAGWLGYIHGWKCADPMKGNPRQYAKKCAAGAMKAEIMHFFGAGRRRTADGIELRQSDLLDHADECSVTPQELAARERDENAVDGFLRELLRPLNPVHRLALYLHFMRNYKVSEVAQAMQIPRRTAQNTIRLGLIALRRSALLA